LVNLVDSFLGKMISTEPFFFQFKSPIFALHLSGVIILCFFNVMMIFDLQNSPHNKELPAYGGSSTCWDWGAFLSVTRRGN